MQFYLWQTLRKEFFKISKRSHPYGEGILMRYFFIWEQGEDSVEEFIETLYALHPTIIFTAE